MRRLFFLLFWLSSLWALSQSLASERIHELAQSNLRQGIASLREFLSIPNYGGSLSDIDANVDWCLTAFNQLGFETSVLIEDGIKHVLAEMIVDPDKPTILFYLQIDGQPVDSSEWDQESPFLPVLKECPQAGQCVELSWDVLEGQFDPDWKIFARSASDSKGPSIAFIQSLRALKENGIKPAFNIKVIMDFQEELGSPKLPALVEKNRELFAANAMLIMDGTRPPGNLPTLTFGARGIATMKLTVYGATTDLHSGQYGNYAPNPVFGLSRLLASMKDEDGRVLIEGFYEGIAMDEDRRNLINSVPDNREGLVQELGISKPEAVGDTYQEAMQYPSLNVRGLRAAWVGAKVRTIIPREAVADLDMRLVPETPAERQIALVEKHIADQGYFIVRDEPTAQERADHPKIIRISSRIGSLPFRTDLSSTLGDWLGDAMRYVFGENNYQRVQATGGSQPIAPFINTLGIPAISVRIPNPDNSIHAPNENLRLGNFQEGIIMCLTTLTHSYE